MCRLLEAGCWFSVVVTRSGWWSYCMLGSVNAQVGDRLWTTGKPPRHGTRHPFLLNLSLPSVQAGMSTRWKWGGGVNRHIGDTSPCPWSRSVHWLPGWMGWLAEISADLTGRGSTLEACLWRCVIQIAAFTLCYFFAFYLLLDVNSLHVCTVRFKNTVIK